jgi:hypothetical protein
MGPLIPDELLQDGFRQFGLRRHQEEWGVFVEVLLNQLAADALDGF